MSRMMMEWSEMGYAWNETVVCFEYYKVSVKRLNGWMLFKRFFCPSRIVSGKM